MKKALKESMGSGCARTPIFPTTYARARWVTQGGAQRSLDDMFGGTASTGRVSAARAAAAAGPHPQNNPNEKPPFGGKRTRPAVSARSRASIDGNPGSGPDSPSEESQEEEETGERQQRWTKLLPKGT